MMNLDDSLPLEVPLQEVVGPAAQQRRRRARVSRGLRRRLRGETDPFGSGGIGSDPPFPFGGPFLLLLLGGFGCFLLWWSYSYLIQSLLDERKQLVLDYNRAMLRWTQELRREFSALDLKISVENRSFVPMRKSERLADVLEVYEKDQVHGLDTDVYKPLVYETKIFLRLTVPDWRDSEKTEPKRVKRLSSAFGNAVRAPSAAPRSRDLHLTIRGSTLRETEVGPLPLRLRRIVNVPELERISAELGREAEEGEKEAVDILGENVSSAASAHRHNPFLHHACTQWTYSADKKPICVQDWYLKSICLLYDPRAKRLRFAPERGVSSSGARQGTSTIAGGTTIAAATTSSDAFAEASHTVCGLPAYGAGPDSLYREGGVGSTPAARHQSFATRNYRPDNYVASEDVFGKAGGKFEEPAGPPTNHKSNENVAEISESSRLAQQLQLVQQVRTQRRGLDVAKDAAVAKEDSEDVAKVDAAGPVNILQGHFSPNEVRPPPYRVPGAPSASSPVVNRNVITILIRHADDPYLLAHDMTGGRMDFGMQAKTGLLFGLVLLLTAVCVCAIPMGTLGQLAAASCSGGGSFFPRMPGSFFPLSLSSDGAFFSRDNGEDNDLFERRVPSDEDEAFFVALNTPRDEAGAAPSNNPPPNNQAGPRNAFGNVLTNVPPPREPPREPAGGGPYTAALLNG